jgi:hypothetical protein
MTQFIEHSPIVPHSIIFHFPIIKSSLEALELLLDEHEKSVYISNMDNNILFIFFKLLIFISKQLL